MNEAQAIDQACIDALYANDGMAVVYRHFSNDYDVVRYSRIQTELQNFDAITRIVSPENLRAGRRYR
jgi:hypothetical protein